jgi:hypothetical protein
VHLLELLREVVLELGQPHHLLRCFLGCHREPDDLAQLRLQRGQFGHCFSFGCGYALSARSLGRETP